MSFRASVIVPVFNAEATIGECLKCLLGQTVPPESYAIVVVDDGSTDRTAVIVRALAEREGPPAIRLLGQEQRGPAAARNKGVAQARGDIILFTDSDCFAEPDWLEKMLAPFDDPEIAGAKGTYRTTQPEWVARFVQLEYESKYRRMAKFRFIDFVDTYSAAFRKDVFLAAGGYDTAFQKPSVEDQEFSFRLAEEGHRMVFVPDAVVRHIHVDSFGGYFRKKFKIGYYKAMLLAKHPDRTRGDTHTPKSLQAQVALGLLFLPVLVLALLRWIPWWVPVGLATVYLGSLVPFTVGALRSDPRVALLSPLMITCRSVALGIGLLAGFGRFGPSGKGRESP